MDNSDIIRLCAAGDRDAMELLYRRYSRKMMSLIRRYVSDPAAAEDILHDGFIVIFTRIRDVRNEDKLEYWMGKIMKNLSLNYLAGLDITQILDEEQDIPETPELEDILSLEELEKLIENLPDGYRKIFKLAVLENKTHREIGKLLGIAPHSSSSQLYHARVLLRKMILERKGELGMLLLAIVVGCGMMLLTGRKKQDNILLGSHNDSTATVAAVDETLTVADNIYDEPQHRNSGKAIGRVVAAVYDTVDTVKMPENISMPSDTMEIGRKDSIPPTAPVVTPVEYAIKDNLGLIADKKRSWSVGVHYNISDDANALSGVFGGSSVDAAPPIWSSPVAPGDNPDLTVPVEIMTDTDNAAPLTFGVSVNKDFHSGMSLETGVSYTMMRTHIRYYGAGIDVHRNIRTHYLGIPLKLNYRLYRHGGFTLYGTAGASLEIPVGSRMSTKWVTTPSDTRVFPRLSSRPQVSVLGGVGLQYSITPNIGLYVEPSLRYWFDNGSSLPSYWQEHQFMISLPVGLRLTW